MALGVIFSRSDIHDKHRITGIDLREEIRWLDYMLVGREIGKIGHGGVRDRVGLIDGSRCCFSRSCRSRIILTAAASSK